MSIHPTLVYQTGQRKSTCLCSRLQISIYISETLQRGQVVLATMKIVATAVFNDLFLDLTELFLNTIKDLKAMQWNNPGASTNMPLSMQGFSVRHQAPRGCQCAKSTVKMTESSILGFIESSEIRNREKKKGNQAVFSVCQGEINLAACSIIHLFVCQHTVAVFWDYFIVNIEVKWSLASRCCVNGGFDSSVKIAFEFDLTEDVLVLFNFKIF